MLDTDWIEVLRKVCEDIKELKVVLPWCFFIWAVVVALSFMILSLQNGERKESRIKASIWLGVSASYLALVIYRCFLNRGIGEYGAVDFRFGETISSPDGYHYYIDNILLFVPFGLLGAVAPNRRKVQKTAGVLLLGALSSIIIEMTQVVSGLGVFHIDDLFANGIGCIIGCLIGCGICLIRTKVMQSAGE